jgi:hypothetical protein
MRWIFSLFNSELEPSAM